MRSLPVLLLEPQGSLHYRKSDAQDREAVLPIPFGRRGRLWTLPNEQGSLCHPFVKLYPNSAMWSRLYAAKDEIRSLFEGRKAGAECVLREFAGIVSRQ